MKMDIHFQERLRFHGDLSSQQLGRNVPLMRGHSFVGGQLFFVYARLGVARLLVQTLPHLFSDLYKVTLLTSFCPGSSAVLVNRTENPQVMLELAQTSVLELGPVWSGQDPTSQDIWPVYRWAWPPGRWRGQNR